MVQLYYYKAKNDKGQVIQGQMVAEVEKDVAVFLRKNGYLILAIRPKIEKKKFFLPWTGQVKSKHLSAFCYQFATMLKAGIPLLNCLEVLKVQGENKTLGKIVQQIVKEIEGGKNITVAFSSYNHIFSNLFLSSVQVGETTGNLDNILERLAVYYKKDHELKTKIKSALSYPLIVLAVTILMTFLFLIFLLPLFQSLFTNMDIKLPFLTSCLFKLGSATQEQYLVFVIVIILAVYFLQFYTSTEKGKIYLDRVKITVPVFGDLLKKMDFARFSMSLSLMIQSGVPLLQALDVAKDTLSNKVLSLDVEKMRSSVQGGQSIASFLEKCTSFPLLMTKMIAVGEMSGSLDVMLDKVAEFYEQEAQSVVESLTTLLEPFLIVFLGLVVGSAVLAILLPMTSLISNVASLGR